MHSSCAPPRRARPPFPRNAIALILLGLSGLGAATPPTPWPEGFEPSIFPDPVRGDLALLGGDLPDGNYGGGQVRADGALQHIAGRHFVAGDGWWVLVCRHEECVLERASLQVREAPHGTYDGPQVPGQRLHLQPMPSAESWLRRSAADSDTGVRPRHPDDSVMLAAFKPLRGLASLPLKRGAVTTWWYSHPRIDPPAPAPYGHNLLPAAERQIQIGASQVLSLRQMPGDDQGESALRLEIEHDGIRQSLGTFIVHMADHQRPVELGEALQWIGDLDGDGRPDLLINHSGYFWDLALWLSSLAKPGELVGEAGRFTYSPPDSAGC